MSFAVLLSVRQCVSASTGGSLFHKRFLPPSFIFSHASIL